MTSELATLETSVRPETRFCPGCSTHRLVGDFKNHGGGRISIQCEDCTRRESKSRERGRMELATTNALRQLINVDSEDRSVAARARAFIQKMDGWDAIDQRLADSVKTDFASESVKARDNARKFTLIMLEKADEHRDIAERLSRLSDEELQGIAFAIITQTVANENNIAAISEACERMGGRFVRDDLTVDGTARVQKEAAC